MCSDEAMMCVGFLMVFMVENRKDRHARYLSKFSNMSDFVLDF